MMLSKVVRVPGVCWGTWNGHACPVSARRHERGMLDGMGLVHFADRQFTRRGAKRLLILVARRTREKDPGFLNNEMYDWYYVYKDAVEAQKLALEHGFRLPAHIFEKERGLAKTLASRRHVSLRRYPRFKSWLAY